MIVYVHHAVSTGTYSEYWALADMLPAHLALHVTINVVAGLAPCEYISPVRQL